MPDVLPVPDRYLKLLAHPQLRDLLRARLLQLAFEQDAGTAVRAAEMFLEMGAESQQSPYATLGTAELEALRERARAWIVQEGQQ